MKNASDYKRALCALLLSGLPLTAQNWQVIDTFEGGVPQGTWSFSDSMSVETADGFLYFYNISPTNTQSGKVALPQSVSSGKMTVAFDLFLPPGQLQHQMGFGVASAAQAELDSWNVAGARNRFQTANAYPQNLVKAGDWDNDALGETQQAVWYNIWATYDLDAKLISLHYRLASEPDSAPIKGGEWAFAEGTTDDLSQIDYFAIGAGVLDEAVAGKRALGGIIDNLYMSTGENLSNTPSTIVELPPSWEFIDSFAGGAPQQTWAGDLDEFALDFSNNYLFVQPTSATSRSNIYVELPQEMLGGRFTVTFDLYIMGEPTDRTEFGFGVVGEEQIVLDGWDQRGGNDRFGTLGAAPQKLTKTGDFSNDLLAPTTQGQWYTVWVYYDILTKTMKFYSAKVGETPDFETPRGEWTFANTYSSFKYFVVGMDRSTNPGFAVANLYFADAELLTLSPTAGQVVADPGESGALTGYADDAVLEWLYGFGNGWALWLADFSAVSWGSVYLAERSEDGYGWLYHNELGEWFFLVAGSMRSDAEGVIAFSTSDGWVQFSVGFGNWYYVFDADGSGNGQYFPILP